jgi:hypothetical protein
MVIQSDIADYKSELKPDILTQAPAIIENSIAKLEELFASPNVDGYFLKLLLTSDLEKLNRVKTECPMVGGCTEMHVHKMTAILMDHAEALEKLSEQMMTMINLYKALMIKVYVYDYYEGGTFNNTEFKKHLSPAVASKGG